MYFCLSKSFLKSCQPHTDFLEKNEAKALQWEAEADLLHVAVQQQQKCRQDYLLETFQTVSLSQFIHFPRRWTKHEATSLLRFLYPAMGDVTRSWYSQYRQLHLKWSCSLPGQSGKRSWHLQSKNDAMPKKMSGEPFLMVSVSLWCPVHIYIKLILVFSEMIWDKSLHLQVAMHVERWGVPNVLLLLSSHCCRSSYCLSCVHAWEQEQHCFCSTGISSAEACVRILLLWTLGLKTIPLTCNSVIKIQCLIQSEVPDGISDAHISVWLVRDITNKSCKFSWNSWKSDGIFYDT